MIFLSLLVFGITLQIAIRYLQLHKKEPEKKKAVDLCLVIDKIKTKEVLTPEEKWLADLGVKGVKTKEDI